MTDKEAIGHLRTIIIFSENDGYTDVAREALKMAIKALQERKTGKWTKDIYGNVVCSECRANRRDNRIGHIAFCNSCGAKMEVEDSEMV